MLDTTTSTLFNCVGEEVLSTTANNHDHLSTGKYSILTGEKKIVEGRIERCGNSLNNEDGSHI
jgi:hypothetical protein